MLHLISNNPFRILGAFANATMKEIVSNLNKAQAFIKIGKTVKFPSDFDLSQFNNGDVIDRNTETLNVAFKAIERTSDKLKAWMFWFINQTPIDNIAFNHINSGDFDTALDIWNKVDNFSAIHNRILIYLLKKDWYRATLNAGTFFSDSSTEICSNVDETLKIDSTELLKIFFSSLENDSPWVIPQIYSDLQKNGLPDNYYKWIGVIEKLYANQEIEQLNKAISKSKTENRKDSHLMRFYVNVYINNGNLHQLAKLLGEDNQEYISIASKVASEALQCTIDYYNHSLNQDDVAEDTLELMNKVLAIAPVGSMARHRCQENIETIKNIIDKLPPKEIRYYHKLLQARIDAYDNEPSTINGASQFLKDCAPYLMSIKTTLGASNEYYINISTRVASAIVNDIIDDFNQQSDKILPKIKSSSGSSRDALLRQFKSVLKSATILMYQLQFIGMDSEFKQKRYQPNYETIKEQAKSAGVITSNSFATWAGFGVSESDFNEAIKDYPLDNRVKISFFITII